MIITIENNGILFADDTEIGKLEFHNMIDNAEGGFMSINGQTVGDVEPNTTEHGRVKIEMIFDPDLIKACASAE